MIVNSLYKDELLALQLLASRLEPPGHSVLNSLLFEARLIEVKSNAAWKAYENELIRLCRIACPFREGDCIAIHYTGGVIYKAIFHDIAWRNDCAKPSPYLFGRHVSDITGRPFKGTHALCSMDSFFLGAVVRSERPVNQRAAKAALKVPSNG